ncbi:NAD(P)H-dependent FMN reductase [Actinoplanes octamycinicus]|uniref:NAD(P)H-dependent FMN reductase n=1 Tax=Actinoplanes octamycinicus TaxID=135948 RepID=A0A7W7M8D3_9ACTN|nr:NAD(P)H-dependent oxidoreductase [Actinoplanes octamycinicus]MBB4740749.1 NAD(P)H-dependent FMN reductase [Actinoplanes octamycinicus]
MTETNLATRPTVPTGADSGSAEPLHLAVIAGSVRDQRMSRAVAEWAAFRAATGAVEVDLIDCAEADLPDDGALRPGGGETSTVAGRIDAADAFVIVTPEYNHSYPAGLKRLIDWHYREWMFKPATILSYGVQGGLLAAEHLRGVFAELHVVTTRRVVGLSRPWEHLGATGFQPPAPVGEAFDAALHELAWWATTLRAARRDRPYAR